MDSSRYNTVGGFESATGEGEELRENSRARPDNSEVLKNLIRYMSAPKAMRRKTFHRNSNVPKFTRAKRRYTKAAATEIFAILPNSYCVG